MEQLTYDELRELNHLIQNKAEEIKKQIINTRMILGFENTSHADKNKFEEIERYYMNELEGFKAIKSKLDLMEAATRHD
ncbi:hypothetical protein [Leptospira santarosai]|uniref:hypothetical protein n=1 Tax=Leptospira santarosai TaxID=28183 RepID=UPI0024AEDDE6|nr:hypothetical protein [Leptospira santarosai]MDI7209078.1 hypothetical protein [Leptospira santarosai]MDI7226216.1 hypothetical protein [Leptospira santarosai]